MWRHITERLSSWKEVFWGKAFLLGAGLWVLLGAWDLFKSEFLPEKYQSWTVVALTPHLQLRTWALILLVIILGVLLEGSHAATQKRDKENAELKSEMAKQSVTGPGKTTMDRDWPGDWKQAEDAFRRLEQSTVRADWFREGMGLGEMWSVCGSGPEEIFDARALCLRAGKLLIVSPMSRHLSAKLLSQNDDVDRWLYFLKARYGLTDQMNGTSVVGGKTYFSLAGSIRSLASVSARACIECGAESF